MQLFSGGAGYRNMGAGASCGQQVSIENNTPYSFELVDDAVVLGKKLLTPDIIPPRKRRHIQNSGRSIANSGSHILYKYRIAATPDNHKWYLKIHSVGAYDRENAGFGLQIMKENEVYIQQNLWGFRPGEYGSKEPHADCPFEITVLDITDHRPNQGIGFYEIPVVIALTDIIITEVFKHGDEEMVCQEACEPNWERDFVFASNNLSLELSRDECMVVEKKTEKKWGHPIKIATNKSFTDSCYTHPAKGSPIDGIYMETDCAQHISIATESIGTKSVIKGTTTDKTTTFQHFFKWNFEEDEMESDKSRSKRIKIASQRKVYRQYYVGRALHSKPNPIVDIGHIDRYEYMHKISYI